MSVRFLYAAACTKHHRSVNADCPYCRITELEAVLNMSEDSLVHEVISAKGLRVVAENKVAELEAENRIFRSTESVDDSVWDALLEQVRVLQVKLDRVRGLPEKWRDISYKTTDAYTNLHGCADELESTLGDEE